MVIIYQTDFQNTHDEHIYKIVLYLKLYNFIIIYFMVALI